VLGGTGSSVLIPDTPIVAATSFTATLPAPRVAAAIGRGLQAGGLPQPELYPISLEREGATGVRALLDALDFDAHMRQARAVVIAGRCPTERRLAGQSLIGSGIFEIATRARQAGVPAYAVLAGNALDSFDARILDLQIVLAARGARALIAAGRKLATVI
jgi:glycerate kinase